MKDISDPYGHGTECDCRKCKKYWKKLEKEVSAELEDNQEWYAKEMQKWLR